MSHKSFPTVRETVVFALFGALLFVSKVITEWAPNIHPLALLILALTAVYRAKALIPVYVFVLMQGIFYGFGIMWVPYLYIWTVLWVFGMLVSDKWPTKVRIAAYIVAGVLHGLLYGTLYAPVWALAFNLSWQGMLTWIATGFPWDCVQAAGNLVFATLVVPLANLLRKLNRNINRL